MDEKSTVKEQALMISTAEQVLLGAEQILATSHHPEAKGNDLTESAAARSLRRAAARSDAELAKIAARSRGLSINAFSDAISSACVRILQESGITVWDASKWDARILQCATGLVDDALEEHALTEEAVAKDGVDEDGVKGG